MMRRLFRRQKPRDDDYDQQANYDEYDTYDDQVDQADYAAYEEYGNSADYQEPDIEPFVPVSGDYYDGDYVYNGEAATIEPPPERRHLRHHFRRHLPRPSLPRFKLPGLNVDLEWGYLLLALFLFAAGIFGVLLKQGDITGSVKVWWPSALVIVGVLWMVIALARRQVASFLGGSAFAGLGLSLLLDAQDIAAAEETILGMVLVAVGLGIVIRGFLLRQQLS